MTEQTETARADTTHADTTRRGGTKPGIRTTVGASMVAIGIVYGDLGTSPVYMTKAVVNGQGGLAAMSRDAVVGSLSLVFWTLTLLATIKYVLIAMRADNHGEGGIFALYHSVARHWKGLAVFAMVGGATFLADSMLTPAVAITSAVEGLRAIPSLEGSQVVQQQPLMLIALLIVGLLFAVQHSGTASIGKLFGPMMTLWFLFIAGTGIANMVGEPFLVEALNPAEGLRFLLGSQNKAGFAILGSVFLTVTGAEALYSDMGHVGRGNIYVSWPFVKIALLLNYFGQGAWILRNNNPDNPLAHMEDVNPFFEMMPIGMRPFAVGFSILAGVIASQALISGAFTLVSEADGLTWLPRLRMAYPGDFKGQIYIPLVNIVLWAGTTAVILFFKTSSHMEAAYGLALTMTMLSTTVLLFVYIWKRWRKPWLACLVCGFFAMVELLFFGASLAKFFSGGYVTIIIAALILAIMGVYTKGHELEDVRRKHVAVTRMLPVLDELRDDDSVPLIADNLVFLTPDVDIKMLDRDVAASIFRGRGKRAHVYWVVTVVSSEEPRVCDYAVEDFGTNYFFRVRIRLGYKMHQYLLQNYLHQIMRDLIREGRLSRQPLKFNLQEAGLGSLGGHIDGIGDMKYVILRKEISPESNLPESSRTIVRLHRLIERHTNSPADWFGIELTDPIEEKVVLYRGKELNVDIKKVLMRSQRRALDERKGAAKTKHFQNGLRQRMHRSRWRKGGSRH
jgi:KUP system potassium uptake protein